MDFGDHRGRKVVLVPHCALNQNARVAGAAERPAGVVELIVGLLERGIGVIQMPCPELQAFGLDRGRVPIRARLQEGSGREVCRRLARELVEQVQEYRACGVEVLGLLGKNGSPSCGVEEIWDGGVVPGTGAFLEALAAELEARGIRMRMTGLRDGESSKALEAVDRWLRSPSGWGGP